jgi:uncharacterized membrane protein SirB2
LKERTKDLLILKGKMLYGLDNFCRWLQGTSLSLAISSTFWVIPVLQMIHILAISSVVSSVFVLDLRLIGVWRGEETPNALSRRLLPFIWWPLPVLLVTGALLITAEPARSLENPSFAIKMSLLAAAIALTLFYQLAYVAKPAATSASGLAARGVGVASLALWIGIVLAGRWIAYTQP